MPPHPPGLLDWNPRETTWELAQPGLARELGHARTRICNLITAWCQRQGIDRASMLLRLHTGQRVATTHFDLLGEAIGTRLERRTALRCYCANVTAAAVSAATVLYLPPEALLLEPLPLVLAAPEPLGESVRATVA